MSYRAPTPVSLAAIEAFVAEDVENGVERVRIGTHLLLALVRYAIAHGAVTAGDLADKPP